MTTEFQRHPDTVTDTQWATLVLLYGLAFCSHFSIALGQLCLVGLMITLLVTVHARWVEARRDPFLWVTVAFLAYLGIRTGLALDQRPDMLYEHLDGARRLFRSGLLPALAVAYGILRIRAPISHAVGLIGALVLGMVVSSLMEYEWSDVAQDIGTRMTFGLGMISHAALALATLFMASMTLGACLLTWKPRNRLRLLGGSVALLIATVSLMGLIQNRTRSVWIGVALAILCGVLYLLWIGIRERRTGARMSAVALLILVGTATTVFHEPIHTRWVKVAPHISDGAIALAEGRIDAIEPGPIGDRIHWAVFGARLLVDRPVLGYGPAESRYLRLERSDVPANIANKPTHFHNGLLDLALRLGGIGVVLLTSAGVWIVHAANQWRKLSQNLPVMFLSAFAISWLIVLGVHQAANHRFLDFNVTYMFALIAGIAHAGWLISRRAGDKPRNHIEQPD